MKQIKLLTIFLFLGLNLRAQSKFSISFEAAPTLSYRSNQFIDYSRDNPAYHSGEREYERILKQINLTESPKYCYQASLKLGYRITERITLQAGIQYKNIGSSWDVPIIDEYIHTGGLNIITYTGKRKTEYSSYYYIGVPINIGLRIISFNKFNIAIDAGYSLEFLDSHEFGRNLNIINTINTVKNPKTTFNVNGGIRLGYNLNERFEVYVMPQFVRYFKPNSRIYMDFIGEYVYRFNQYYYFGALNFGVKFNL